MRSTIIASLLAATIVLAGDSSPVVTAKTVGTFFGAYPRLTQQPRKVSRVIGLSCTLPPGETWIAREKEVTGPHYDALVHIYASKEADSTFRHQKYPFATDTVIVKEKIDKNGKQVGVGGMIKRAVGYDRANGNWEYFYWDAAVGFNSGKLANCAGCHMKAKETDFVYTASEATVAEPAKDTKK